MEAEAIFSKVETTQKEKFCFFCSICKCEQRARVYVYLTRTAHQVTSDLSPPQGRWDSAGRAGTAAPDPGGRGWEPREWPLGIVSSALKIYTYVIKKSFKMKEHIKVILLGDFCRETWSFSLWTWKHCPFVPIKKDALHIQSLIKRQKDTEVHKQSWNQAHRMLP